MCIFETHSHTYHTPVCRNIWPPTIATDTVWRAHTHTGTLTYTCTLVSIFYITNFKTFNQKVQKVSTCLHTNLDVRPRQCNNRRVCHLPITTAHTHSHTHSPTYTHSHAHTHTHLDVRPGQCNNRRVCHSPIIATIDSGADVRAPQDTLGEWVCGCGCVTV